MEAGQKEEMGDYRDAMHRSIIRRCWQCGILAILLTLIILVFAFHVDFYG